MKESLASEHESKLIRNTLPRLLDSSRVADEDAGHLHASGRDVANGRLHVVRDPLYEVGGVLVHDVEHLVVHLLGGHATAEHHGAGEVAAVTWVSSAHHILRVESLLRELRDREDPVILGFTGSEGGKSDQEEVQAGERDHVDSELTQIAVKLPREAKGACRSRDGCRDEMVQVAVAGVRKFERAEANVVQSLIVEGKALI
mmetsp:Transcript_13922/g.40727  ORF Transcript_13922/g.40727 Transcript_13922/m.40727 type:complete len:201 (-) Transcript_13922:723-1325(-)